MTKKLDPRPSEHDHVQTCCGPTSPERSSEAPAAWSGPERARTRRTVRGRGGAAAAAAEAVQRTGAEGADPAAPRANSTSGGSPAASRAPREDGAAPGAGASRAAERPEGTREPDLFSPPPSRDLRLPSPSLFSSEGSTAVPAFPGSREGIYGLLPPTPCAGTRRRPKSDAEVFARYSALDSEEEPRYSTAGPARAATLGHVPCDEAGLDNLASTSTSDGAGPSESLEGTQGDPSEVEYGFSIHAVAKVDGGVRLHLVLKFHYRESLISKFGAVKPGVPTEKSYQSSQRLFPYCIFNAIDEIPISWTYQNTDGMVRERIELYTTVTLIRFMRYFPFVLNLLTLKLGTDGTADTKHINLKPKRREDFDITVFTRDTAEFKLRDAIQSDDFMVLPLARDLTVDPRGNFSGHYMRVYSVFFFHADWKEDLFKFIVLSTFLSSFSIWVPRMEIGDGAATSLAIILAQVALIWVMPPTAEFTTSELIIACQIYFTMFLYIVVRHRQFSGDEEGFIEDLTPLIVATALLAVVTTTWTLTADRSYKRLLNSIKAAMNSKDFDRIDAKI